MSRVAVIGIVGNSVFLPVENFHVGGETVEAISAHFEPGGKGFNAAVAAKRFGAQVSFLAALGSEGSEGIEAFLEKEGIDCTLVHKSGAGAFAAIITDKNGSNRVTVYQGVQLDCTDVDLFESEIASSDVLLLNNEVPENVNIKAVMIAKKHGVPVIAIVGGADGDMSAAYEQGVSAIFTINRLPQDFSVSRFNSKENLDFAMDNILRALKI